MLSNISMRNVKFCQNFWVKKHTILVQKLLWPLTVFNRLRRHFYQNKFICVCIIQGWLWCSFSIGIPSWVRCAPPLLWSYICVQQALESIQKCNGADVNNNDSNMCSCAQNKLCVWSSVGFSIHTWWRWGWKKKTHSNTETFAGKHRSLSIQHCIACAT